MPLLSDLLQGVSCAVLQGTAEVSVGGVCTDSRRAGPGDLFVALRGRTVDSHERLAGLGAAAALVERPVPAPPGLTLVQVPDTRLALAQVSAAFWGHPAEQLQLVGVTGTNGKTTVTWLVEALLAHAGWRVGVIGTTGNRVAGQASPAGFTTPEAPQWQALLAQMVAAGCGAAVAEVSSIGLHARRVDASRFAVGVYTNLTQDHLDYHGTMEAYAQAKARLFTELLAPDGVAVLNGEDPVVQALPPLRQRTLRFGLERGDLRPLELVVDTAGARGRLLTPAGERPFTLPLLGRHNVANALAAAGVGLALGLELDAVVAGLAQAPQVPGRLERVPNERGVLALVDYAHTPDGLRTVLAALRGLGGRRILLVFGCGGDRDRGKRPLMAREGALGADLLFVTSDNPRSEDPGAIWRDMEPGLGGAAAVWEPLRDRAIAAAVAAARPGDVVLVAGKGHETTQEIAGVKHPFDDRVELARCLGAP